MAKLTKTNFMSALPYILDVFGVAAFIGGSVAAYKKSDKTHEVVAKHTEYRQDLKATYESEDPENTIDKKAYKKLMAKDTASYIWDVTKSQWQTVALDATGIACVTVSDVLQHKNIANALKKVAAYAAMAGAADLNMALNNAGVPTNEIEEAESVDVDAEANPEATNGTAYLEIVMNYDNSPIWRATRGGYSNLLHTLGSFEKNFIEQYNREGWYDLYMVCDYLNQKDIVDAFGENFLREHGAVKAERDENGVITNDSINIIDRQAAIRPNVSFFNISYTDADETQKLLDYCAPDDGDEHGHTGYLKIFIPYETKPINGRRPSKK